MIVYSHTEIVQNINMDKTALGILQRKKERLSEEISKLEIEIEEKNIEEYGLILKIKQLDDTNESLVKEIEYLTHSKLQLLVNTNKCINNLRNLLIKYQTQLN